MTESCTCLACEQAAEIEAARALARYGALMEAEMAMRYAGRPLAASIIERMRTHQSNRKGTDHDA